VNLVQKVAGCLSAQYGMDSLDENTFRLTITWDHSKSWDHYRQTDDYKVLMGMKNLLTHDFKIVTQDVDSRQPAA
jgi:quinol monooxygenase YgiN